MSESHPPSQLPEFDDYRLPTPEELSGIAAGKISPAASVPLAFTPGMLALPSLPEVLAAERTDETRRSGLMLSDSALARWQDAERQAVERAIASRPVTLGERIGSLWRGGSGAPDVIDRSPPPGDPDADLWWLAAGATAARLPRELYAAPEAQRLAVPTRWRFRDLAAFAADSAMEAAEAYQSGGSASQAFQTRARQTSIAFEAMSTLTGGWRPRMPFLRTGPGFFR